MPGFNWVHLSQIERPAACLPPDRPGRRVLPYGGDHADATHPGALAHNPTREQALLTPENKANLSVAFLP